MGKILSIEVEGGNKRFEISNPFEEDIYIDQSISHNGVCLTVVEITKDAYAVDIIAESLKKSNFGQLQVGEYVNLERSMKIGNRIDGHIVQGHVDNTAIVKSIVDANGSWTYNIEIPKDSIDLVVPKGSICINGISLTIADLNSNIVTVAIIPYTYEHTNMKLLQVGSLVNVEYDVFGKYVINYLKKIRT